MSSEGRNQSKSHQLARIGEKMVFHELDVHHVWKEGIKCFWPKEAEISLTAISSLELVRRKVLFNSKYIISIK